MSSTHSNAGEDNQEHVEQKPVPETNFESSAKILSELKLDDEEQQAVEWSAHKQTPYDYDSFQRGVQEVTTTDASADGLGEWAASGARYEWKEEYGDVAPADKELEKVLFGEAKEQSHAGIQFDK